MRAYSGTAGCNPASLLQSSAMADWRQIQARIRKAKSGADPSAQLAALYEKTRDAMVAFELATLHEKAGQHAEAVRWYSAAAERFRRAQWKTKAEQALARLGDPSTYGVVLGETMIHAPEVAEAETPIEGASESSEKPVASGEPPAAQAAAAGEAQAHKRRRRGRRGGRRRHRGKAGTGPAGLREPIPTEAEVPRPVAFRPRTAEAPPEHSVEPAAQTATRASASGEPIAWQTRGRAGEPALASRLAHLESQLRRLLASSLYRVDEADQAPAGPGVFIVSDSDQTTYYYIEACQTLRIGIGNLLRGERGSRRPLGDSLRPRFADHL